MKSKDRKNKIHVNFWLDSKYRTIKNLSKHNPHECFYIIKKKNLKNKGLSVTCRVMNPDIILITKA